MTAVLRKRSNWLSWVALAGVVAVQLWVNFRGYRPLFNSDDAAFLVAAQEAQSQGLLFPSHWLFVNGDFWLHYTLSYRLLATLAPLGFWAHSVAQVFVNAYLWFAFWIAAKSFGLSGSRLRWGLALVGSGFTYPLFMNLWVANYYGVVLANFILLGVLAWRLVVSRNAMSLRAYVSTCVAFAVVISLAVATSPARAVAFYALPIAMALLVANRDRSAHGLTLIRSVRVAVFAAGASLIGVLVYVWLASQAIVVGSPKLKVRSLADLPEAIANTISSLGTSLGLWAGKDYTFGEIKTAFVWLAVLELALIILLAIRNARSGFKTSTVPSDQPRIRSYFLWLAVMLNAVVFGLLLGTSFDATVRYLTPGVAFAITLLLWTVLRDWSNQSLSIRRLFAALAIVLVMSLGISVAQLVEAGARVNKHEALAQVLVEEGLSKGYAPYWDASVTAALSNSRLTVAPVKFNPKSGTPLPMYWASNAEDFMPSGGEEFLALPTTPTVVGGISNAAPPVDFGNSAWQGIKPIRNLERAGFRVYVFDSGDLQKLTEWSQLLELIEKTDSPKG